MAYQSAIGKQENRVNRLSLKRKWLDGLGLACTVACLVLVLAGCGRRREEPIPEVALAHVGDVAITEEHVAFEVQRRKEAGRPIGTSSEIVADLVEREAMLQRARTSETLADPAVQRELENQMLVKWLDQELHRRRDAVSVSDEELEAYYSENQDSFRTPALWRVAILYRRTTSQDPEETQASVAAALSDARARFLDDPGHATRDGRLQGFGVIAAEHSEHTVSRYRGGDLGWLESGQLEHRLPSEAREALRSLEVGDVSDVLASGDGLYVVMKTGFREARVQPFQEVASGLRRRVIRERQEAIETEFRQQLLEQANVTVHAERVSQLDVPQGASSGRSASEPRDAAQLPALGGDRL